MQDLIADSARLRTVGGDWQSGAELLARAAELARSLDDLAPASRVVIAADDGATVLQRLFACWQAGQAAVVVNPALKPEERDRVIAATGAALWWQEGAERLSDPAPATELRPDLILMTSGTTGIPKGVCLSRAALAHRIAVNRAAIGDGALRRTLCPLPVFFGHGLIGNCLTALAAGGEVTLLPQGIGTAAGLGPMIDETRATFLSSVPTFWKLALRGAGPRAAPERVHVGSAPLSVPAWEAIADWCGTRNVWNMYGMTETANWVGGAPLDAAGGRDGFVGCPWEGRAAVWRDGAVHQTGEGEVLVQTAAVTAGFWGRPDQTRAAFADGWYRSGDIGEVTADGAITLKGRIKFEINHAGLKILAEEVDMLLERHPDVAEACAFAIPDPVAGEAVGAAVVAASGDLDPDALRAWAAERARAEAVPRLIRVLPALPRSDRGKIRRDDVRALCLEAGR